MISSVSPWLVQPCGSPETRRGGSPRRFLRVRRGNVNTKGVQIASCLTICAVRVVGVTLALAIGSIARADGAFGLDHPVAASVQLQQQHLVQLFQEKLKDNRPEVADRARTEFLEFLRRSSPLASENFINGKMDDDELESRVNVFLRDRPALTGAVTSVEGGDPRKQVAELLRHDSAGAGTEGERLALADRFLERLGQRSPTAHAELLQGKMSPEELQSRVNVFTADLRTEAAAAPVDPKAAEVKVLVDAFVKANFGEQANDMIYRAQIEAGGVRRECVVFRKRPGKIRMHIVDDGLVIGILGFDGTTAWRQQPGKAGVPATTTEAATLRQLARFDDPLVDYREHGTEVQLAEKPEKGPFQLHIRESDGAELIAAIDPVTYNEVSLRTRQADGKWRELRFSDYRKLGALNLAYVQEDWEDGALRSTTRITDARIDAGLIDRFFVRPLDRVLSYMDFMGGLAAIKAQQRQQPPALKSSSPGGVR